MITIKNIQKIGGEMCLGRRIWNVTEEANWLGERFYCFHFRLDGNGLDFNKPTEVRLNREPDVDGEYELFVMGLAKATGIHITQQSIRDKEQLLSKIAHVMNKSKQWWEENAV